MKWKSAATTNVGKKTSRLVRELDLHYLRWGPANYRVFLGPGNMTGLGSMTLSPKCDGSPSPPSWISATSACPIGWRISKTKIFPSSSRNTPEPSLAVIPTFTTGRR